VRPGSRVCICGGHIAIFSPWKRTGNRARTLDADVET
jgi:hypothetical protein